MLCLLVSALIINQCLFGGLFSATFFAFLCFLLVLFIMPAKYNGELLSSVPKSKKTEVPSEENVSEKLHSSTAGFEFNVNEVTVY